jgi:hypothetical protein
MDSGSSQIRNTKGVRQAEADKWKVEADPTGTGHQAELKEEGTMEHEARSRGLDAVQAHPLAELLACPPATGNLLNGSAKCVDFDAGETVFRQKDICQGLYVVVSGQFLRRTERLEMRLTLGPARAGDLLELAAALGDGHHNYTLCAQTPGSVLLLPTETLNLAFQDYPPLRMQLLEELAREVSRAYYTCCLNRTSRIRRGSPGAGAA